MKTLFRSRSHAGVTAPVPATGVAPRTYAPGAHHGISILLCLAALCAPVPAAATVNGKVFPFLTYTRQTNVPSQGPFAKDEFARGADLFGLVTYKEWRVLSEILVDNTEGDWERLQFGRWVGENTLLWLGRFHTPSAYWDMVYHHSPYLQTSISRPQIMAYEDDGGVLPTHIWGVRADETIERGTGEWQFHFGLGQAPAVTRNGLQPVEALDPKSFNDRLAAVFVTSFLPDTYSTNEIGAFLSAVEMPAGDVGLGHARQITGGAFANWTFAGRLHLISSVFRVHSLLKGAGCTSHGFFSGYAQPEFQLTPRWRGYVRYEFAIGISGDPYLDRLPTSLAHNAEIGGVRFDVTKRQALSFEYGHLQYENAHPNRFMLQWSAMFP